MTRSHRLVVGLAAAAAITMLTAIAAAHVPGRMTGGGSVFRQNGDRVTHGFELHCAAPEGATAREPNRLQVNWPGHRFHLLTLTKAECSNEFPEESPPEAGFDTYRGAGTGRCDGQTGATATWTFRDDGEPGTTDFARIEVDGCPDGAFLNVFGNLRKGDHQAHRATP